MCFPCNSVKGKVFFTLFEGQTETKPTSQRRLPTKQILPFGVGIAFAFHF